MREPLKERVCSAEMGASPTSSCQAAWSNGAGEVGAQRAHTTSFNPVYRRRAGASMHYRMAPPARFAWLMRRLDFGVLTVLLKMPLH